MSTPTPPRSGLPRFFLDRNLGRYAVPRGLREAGIDVKLQAFIVNGQIPAAEVVRRFLTSRDAIVRACQQAGPFVYRLHPDRLERRQIRP